MGLKTLKNGDKIAVLRWTEIGVKKTWMLHQFVKGIHPGEPYRISFKSRTLDAIYHKLDCRKSNLIVKHIQRKTSKKVLGVDIGINILLDDLNQKISDMGTIVQHMARTNVAGWSSLISTIRRSGGLDSTTSDGLVSAVNKVIDDLNVSIDEIHDMGTKKWQQV